VIGYIMVFDITYDISVIMSYISEYMTFLYSLKECNKGEWELHFFRISKPNSCKILILTHYYIYDRIRASAPPPLKKRQT